MNQNYPSYEEQQKIIGEFTLMDDIFMKAVFKNKDCAQLLINIILGRTDIKIDKLEIQSDKTDLVYKAVIMDIFAVDKQGALYNIEVQKANKGADPKRARYHSSIMDTHILQKGQTAKDLPNTYVIFITENDVLGKDKMIYHIDRIIRETNDEFKDGAKIIYANTSKQDETALGKLMSDMRQSDPDKMHYEELRQKSKKTKNEYIVKEGKKMGKLMEQFYNDAKAEGRVEGRQEGRAEGRAEGRQDTIFAVAKKMLGENIDMSLIEKITGLSKDKLMML